LADDLLFEIEGTVSVEHHPGQRAVVGTWRSLSTAHLREGLERGLKECGRLGALSWIADLSLEPGVPSQEDLHWIQTTAVSLCKKYGLRAVINVLGASAVAKMGAKRWSKSASDAGMSTYDCASLADALQLALDVATGKAA
jgi:hypothetical protein